MTLAGTIRTATSLVGRGLAAVGAATDAAVAPLAPGLARRRAENRLRFRRAHVLELALAAHAAAAKDRTTADWKAKPMSADQEIVADLGVLNARARETVRNTWDGRSAVGAYRRHVVGTGIVFRSNARDPRTGQEYSDFVKALNRLWRRWVRSPAWVDVEGKRTFLDFQKLAISEFVTVGEAFLALAYEPRPDMVGLMLQAFEPEQLDWSLLANRETGNQIRGGIEINAQGRAVAYWLVTEGHPLESGSAKARRVPADRVRHFLAADRVRQTHGATQFRPVLIKHRHVGLYDEYETIAKRVEACIGGWRKRGLGSGPAPLGLATPPGETGKDAGGNEQLEFAPGMILDLGETGEFGLINPQRPGAQYAPFMQQQLMEIAAGLGLDYGTLVRDYTKATYSGQRQGLLELWAETDPIQETLVTAWLLPVWEEFVRLAILEGRVLPPAEYWTDPEVAAACLEADWQPPPKYWIDPARQAAAVKILLDERLTCRAIELAKLGYEWREIFDMIADEEAYAEKRGVALPEAGGDPAVSPVEPRPGSEAGGGPEDRPGSGEREADLSRARRRRPGRNGDRLAEAVLLDALRGGG